MSDKQNNKVFISFARNDDQLADELARLLVENGLKVWSDESIEVGSDWQKEIYKALSESDYIICLLTERSYSSNFVRKELDYALFNNRFKNKFLPVLIGSGRENEFNRVPWLIKKINHLFVSDKKPPKVIASEITNSFLRLVESQEAEQ